MKKFLTEEEIRNKVKEYFKDNSDFCTHDEWEEDGNRCSSWTFVTPGCPIIRTGDGGAKMMMDALEELIKKEINGK